MVSSPCVLALLIAGSLQAAPTSLQPEHETLFPNGEALLEASHDHCSATCTQAVFDTPVHNAKTGSTHTCGKRILHRAEKEMSHCGTGAVVEACSYVATKFSECSACMPAVQHDASKPCSAKRDAPTPAPTPAPTSAPTAALSGSCWGEPLEKKAWPGSPHATFSTKGAAKAACEDPNQTPGCLGISHKTTWGIYYTWKESGGYSEGLKTFQDWESWLYPSSQPCWGEAMDSVAWPGSLQAKFSSKEAAMAACEDPAQTPGCLGISQKLSDGGTGGGETGMYYTWKLSGGYSKGLETFQNWQSWRYNL